MPILSLGSDEFFWLSIGFQPFKACQLLYVPPGLTLKNSACWLHCIYVFYMDLRTNSFICLIHH